MDTSLSVLPYLEWWSQTTDILFVSHSLGAAPAGTMGQLLLDYMGIFHFLPAKL